ncbi:MAG TPA: SprT-like domain-containing protein [Bryobacteraceae bacterium]|jgi:hypothetical protein|nr:SprT-like domain-containing protein [Bryobacteraceae bacterium]
MLKRVGIETAILIETPEEIFLRVYRDVRPYARVPDVTVQFRRFANANSRIRLEDSRLVVRITDVLEGAPAFVLEALAHILICKLARKKPAAVFPERYRRYLNRKEMRRSLHLLRQIRGRKVFAPPKGKQYDLEAIFEDLNFRFFHGLMARPSIGWSVRASRHTLGHYDPSHNAIVLSRILDRSDVPKLAVEYVMYHEMLHLRFPVEHRGARRCVHTEEFKNAERQFPEWRTAQDLLKKL